MMRFLFAGFLSLTFFFSPILQAQVPSPEEFLGYPLGARYTPHYRIVQYFEKVASLAPARMKFEVYGQTYEHRPLTLAIISSEENMRNLENIRKNNLARAGLGAQGQALSEEGPVLVWLSYNVHGNEPSSSEAAMKTLHALLQSGGKAAEWLKNTVVLIDPCLNPDGRDRYANWQNSVTSLQPDPDPQSREHREPWPGGRTNHYYFDLNRDWAWQTQVESRHRIKIYHEWLPQVHVDFHEQGFNEPYYFAPAAEPYHEVITPWQREFQQLVGRNNARYFDERGWLYFTKERFDLFYPSYGDTYPTYNGAIGMTFEQGGIRGGLAIETEDGDTLTLADRIEHHYTTGLSTVEVSSKNAGRLVKEFRKFYTDAVAGNGLTYRYYVIRKEASMGAEGGTIGSYLRQNQLKYGYATSKTPTRGFNYVTGKEEAFTIQEGDIVIPAQQPKSAMVRVLFEPNARISDSATYDITAWALPYAMGLQAFAVKDKIALPGLREQSPVSSSGSAVGTLPDNAYAYLIPWTGFGSAKVLAQLLNAGIKVRYAEQAFDVAGKKFNQGSLIITRAANQSKGSKLSGEINRALEKCPDFHESVTPIQTGYVDKGFDLGSDRVRYIRKPRVVILAGEGAGSNAAGELWHYFEQQLKYPVTVLQTSDVDNYAWKHADVLIIPDGYYRFLSDKNSVEKLKAWVQQGGRIIAIENAASQLSAQEWAVQEKKKEEGKKESEAAGYEFLKRYEDREKEYLSGSIPGAVYRVELDNSHPLAFGYPSTYYTLKQSDVVYNFMKSGGWNVGVVKKEGYVTGFAGIRTRDKIKDGLVLGVQEIGRGQLVYFADDPIFRGFWENGKLLLANAVFLVGQ